MQTALRRWSPLNEPLKKTLQIIEQLEIFVTQKNDAAISGKKSGKTHLILPVDLTSNIWYRWQVLFVLCVTYRLFTNSLGR